MMSINSLLNIHYNINLEKNIHGDKFRTHNLELGVNSGTFPKYCLFGHNNFSSEYISCCLPPHSFIPSFVCSFIHLTSIY